MCAGLQSKVNQFSFKKRSYMKTRDKHSSYTLHTSLELSILKSLTKYVLHKIGSKQFNL